MQADRANDQVRKFLGDILDQKNLPGADIPEVREQLIDDIESTLYGQIERAMVAALNQDQAKRLNQMLDSPDITDDQIQDFFRRSGVDGASISFDCMMKFRQYYLGDNVETTVE